MTCGMMRRMMTTESRIDSESLVARIIDELRANPEAKRLLLRALYKDEFPSASERLERDGPQDDVPHDDR